MECEPDRVLVRVPVTVAELNRHRCQSETEWETVLAIERWSGNSRARRTSEVVQVRVSEDCLGIVLADLVVAASGRGMRFQLGRRRRWPAGMALCSNTDDSLNPLAMAQETRKPTSLRSIELDKRCKWNHPLDRLAQTPGVLVPDNETASLNSSRLMTRSWC